MASVVTEKHNNDDANIIHNTPGSTRNSSGEMMELGWWYAMPNCCGIIVRNWVLQYVVLLVVMMATILYTRKNWYVVLNDGPKKASVGGRAPPSGANDNDVFYNPNNNYHQTSSMRTTKTTSTIPFIVLVEPQWKILQKSLDAYRIETHHMLEQLSMALEVVLSTEQQQRCTSSNKNNNNNNNNKFSHLLQEKIQRLSDIYETDWITLQQLVLKPFPITYTLPRNASASSNPITVEATTNAPTSHPQQLPPPNRNESGFTWWSSSSSRLVDNRPYDSARQVVAHLVRDWGVIDDNEPTTGATPTFRTSMYSWCVAMVRQHYHPILVTTPILVPGAGLGRLAWELATQLDHVAVEAVESSLSMAAAAHAIFHLGQNEQSLQRSPQQQKQPTSFELHPYAADAFANEVDGSDRYKRVRFPDVNPIIHNNSSSLSYTITDFNYETMSLVRDYYGVVVTCYFVDTATTVYDYLSTISMVLTKGGVWINLGPLQWHMNTQVPATANELRMIIENYCDSGGQPTFKVLHWSIDTSPMSYRNQGLSTRTEGYYPLRFVVRKIGGK